MYNNNYTIEEQGMLKILEHLYLLIKNGKQVKAGDVRNRVGLELRYWVILINNKIIELQGIASKPVYKWVGIQPNINMASKLLSEKPDLINDKYDNINIPSEYKSEQKKINIPFNNFWNLYDKKVGPKDKCEKLWNKLSNKDRKKIIEILPLWLAAISDKQYQPHPHTYLSQKRWNDEIKINTYVSKPQSAINTTFPLSNYSDQQLWDELIRRGYNIVGNRLGKTQFLKDGIIES